MKFGRQAPPPRRQRVRPAENAEPAAPSPNITYQPRRRGSSTGEAVKRTGRSWLQRAGLIVLLIAGFISLVNVLSLSSNAKVLPFNSGDALTLHSQAEYQAAASKFLAESSWNRNKITVNTAEVSRQMRAKFPELTDVSVTIPLLAHRPVVYVEPAKPAVILATSQGAFLLNNAGKALVRADNPADLQQPSLPVVTDQSSLPLKLNSQAVPATTVQFIQIVVAQLAAKQYKTTEIILPSNGGQLDLKLEGEPYTVKFNLQNADARQQAGTFLATIKHLKERNSVPAQYIDVRVDGRAYYK